MELCTECRLAGHKVEHVSDVARVDYYRCPHCGAVWTADKQSNGSDGTSEMALTEDKNLPSSTC